MHDNIQNIPNFTNAKLLVSQLVHVWS